MLQSAARTNKERPPVRSAPASSCDWRNRPKERSNSALATQGRASGYLFRCSRVNLVLHTAARAETSRPQLPDRTTTPSLGRRRRQHCSAWDCATGPDATPPMVRITRTSPARPADVQPVRMQEPMSPAISASGAASGFGQQQRDATPIPGAPAPVAKAAVIRGPEPARRVTAIGTRSVALARGAVADPEARVEKRGARCADHARL